MQKRLARKIDLERLLAKVEPHHTPKPSLEQYTIPTTVAATMLWIAAYVNDDLVGRTVLDLGCGTGRLALGAAFLGAAYVVGVDIDKTAVSAAYENSLRLDLKEKVQWIVADINAINGDFDTVLQNPPYGVQRRGADREFLKMGLASGKRIYSLHKSPPVRPDRAKPPRFNSNSVAPVGPCSFLKKFIDRNGGRIQAVHRMTMSIPHMFSFHIERKHEFQVDLYVIEKR